MADYAVTFARSARRELEVLDTSIVRRLVSRIDGLVREPRPSRSRKLQGEQNVWRIRVGDYRVVYSVQEWWPCKRYLFGSRPLSPQASSA